MWSPALRPGPAGAPHFLEQRLHPAVRREPAPPGRSRDQLLREARGCVSRVGACPGVRGGGPCTLKASRAAPSPPPCRAFRQVEGHAPEGEALRGAGGRFRDKSCPGVLPSSSVDKPRGHPQGHTAQRRRAGAWLLEVRAACLPLSECLSVPWDLGRSAHLHLVGAWEAARSFLPCRGFWGLGSSCS